MKYLLFYISVLCLYSCTKSNTEKLKKVYNYRSSIANSFLSKSIFRSRGQNIILLYTHQNNKTNKYFFEIDNRQYRFINDSIEYIPDLLRLKYERGSDLYKQELISQIKTLLKEMDELDIRDVSSELAAVGINLKIHMKSQGVILYVPNLQKVQAPRFKPYINSMIKFDDNWYYTLKE